MKKVKAGDEVAKLGQLKIKSVLKLVLKQRGHTYKDVAEVWDCSEPTVKRQLGSEELSLARLLSLLDWLGLSLAELHTMTESGSLDEARYTARQNEFLAKNPRAFAFLMKLFEISPKEIAEKYGLSAQDRDQILIQLEKYDLIRPGARAQMRPTYQRPPLLDGRLGEVHTRDFIDRFGAYFKNKIALETSRQLRGLETQKGSLSANIGEVTLKTYNEYRERAAKLSRDLESAAKVDESMNKKSDLKACVTMVGFFLDDVSSRELEGLKDFFGEMLKAPLPQSNSF